MEKIKVLKQLSQGSTKGRLAILPSDVKSLSDTSAGFLMCLSAGPAFLISGVPNSLYFSSIYPGTFP